MPISSVAIDKFLHKPIPWSPKFKGADEDWLKATIFDVTGKPYKPKTQPRPHQLEGLAFALYQRRCLLFYSMRLGKTLMSLQFAEQLRLSGHWRGKGIIICHAPIAIWVWESEAEKHSRLKVRGVRNKVDELIEALDSDTDLIVIPWSGLQNIFTEMRVNKKGKNKLYPDLVGARIAAEGFSLGIIDEIHGAKNPQSLRFQLAKEILSNCRYRIGLTGTPFGRDPFAVWAQAYLIDGGETLGWNYQFFEASFGTKKANWFSKADEFAFDKKKQPILEEKLAAISLPYRLEECQQVPVYPGTVELQIVGDQLRAYEECVQKLVKFDDHEKTEIQNTFIRLRQISSGYLPFIDSYGNDVVSYFKENAKLEWLVAFLEELKEVGAAFVIFHEFTLTGNFIHETLTKAGISHHWLHGATKDKPGVVAAFQEGKVDAIIVQSATGSQAIDLHRADYLLFFESPVSPIVRAQAEARPLSAARQDRPLLLDDIACSGVERKILSYITSGKNLMSAIIHERKSLVDGEKGRSSKRNSKIAY